MSSLDVREDLKTYFDASTSEVIIDISGETRDLLTVMQANSIGVNDECLFIQFIGSNEEPISVQAGCYRETGTMYIHVIAPVAIGAIDGILTRCKTIRSIFRGKRVDNIVIESVSPPNTETGTTVEINNNYTSASFFIDYYADIKE